MKVEELKTYSEEELNSIIEKHKLWLKGAPGGEKADLSGSDLRGCDLRGCDLRGCDLRDSDLRGSDLSYSDLRGCILRDSDLIGANIDYAAWGLWCGTLKVHVDDRIAIQLLYHTLSVIGYSKNVSEDVKRTLLTQEIVDIANRFHRVDEYDKTEVYNASKDTQTT